MGKCQPVRPQGNITAILIEAILSVTHQGQLPAGKLAADLVGSARMEPDGNAAKAAVGFQQAIIQDRLLDTFRPLLHHIGLAFPLIPQQQIHQSIFSLFRAAMNHRQVFLVKFPIPDLPGQLSGRLLISRQHHQTTDHPVQPVDGAHLGLLIPQCQPCQLRHTAGLICGQCPGRLDAHNHIFVCINQLHWFHLLFPFYQKQPINAREIGNRGNL